MGNIYKHCAFTISAESSQENRDSILENYINNETEYIQQGCHSLKEDFRGSMYTFSGKSWQAAQTDRGFRRPRAWALQERVLLPRTL